MFLHLRFRFDHSYFACMIGRASKIAHQRVGHLERNFSIPDDKLFLKRISTSMPEKKSSLTDMKIILSFMVVFKINIINYVSFR